MNDDVGKHMLLYVPIMNDDKIIIVKIKTKNYFYVKKNLLLLHGTDIHLLPVPNLLVIQKVMHPKGAITFVHLNDLTPKPLPLLLPENLNTIANTYTKGTVIANSTRRLT